MTRPTHPITGRYLAKESPKAEKPVPGANSAEAQLARYVIAQAMAFRGGVK